MEEELEAQQHHHIVRKLFNVSSNFIVFILNSMQATRFKLFGTGHENIGLKRSTAILHNAEGKRTEDGQLGKVSRVSATFRSLRVEKLTAEQQRRKSEEEMLPCRCQDTELIQPTEEFHFQNFND